VTRLSILCLALLLGGCVSLPGSDNMPPQRYMLQGPDSSCEAGARPLAVSVVKVGAGLATERIAQRDARTGEYTYLRGVRWVDQAGAMLEQRLAADLECRGYTVLTSHRQTLSQDQLVCEVRSLNLVDHRGDEHSAEVSLSCLYIKAAAREDIAIQARGQSTLQSWSADHATAAVGDAYGQALAALVAALP